MWEEHPTIEHLGLSTLTYLPFSLGIAPIPAQTVMFEVRHAEFAAQIGLAPPVMPPQGMGTCTPPTSCWFEEAQSFGENNRLCSCGDCFQSSPCRPRTPYLYLQGAQPHA